MSIRPDNTLISNREMLLELLATPFRALGALLHHLAENNSRIDLAQQRGSHISIRMSSLARHQTGHASGSQTIGQIYARCRLAPRRR